MKKRHLFENKVDYTEIKHLSVQHLLRRIKSKDTPDEIKDKIAVTICSKDIASKNETTNNLMLVKNVDLKMLTIAEKEKMLEQVLLG